MTLRHVVVVVVGLAISLAAFGCSAPRLYIENNDVQTPLVEVRLDAAVLGTVAYGEHTSFEVPLGAHELELCRADDGSRVWPAGDAPSPVTVEQDLRVTLHGERQSVVGAEPDDE